MPFSFTSPLLPASAIKPLQDAIAPSADSSPAMASIRGFGQGALEGLRGLTTPANIATGLASLIPGVGEGAAMAKGAEALPGAVEGLARAIPGFEAMAPEVVEAGQGVKQAMPGADDVESLIGQMKYNLAKATSKAPTPQTLGEMSPDFTPQGGEGAYNAARPAPSAAPNPIDAVMQKIQSTMGPKAPNPPPTSNPLTPFQKLQEAGAFGGSRTNTGFAAAPGSLHDVLPEMLARLKQGKF